MNASLAWLGSLGVATLVAIMGAAACGSDAGDNPGSSSGQSDGGNPFVSDGGDTCEKKTCEELGWACGYMVDACGNAIDCAAEGRACPAGQLCVGGVDGNPTQCVAGGAGTCEVCGAIPDCTGKPQKTKLTGRVVTPGRTDGNTANQVGVPNAIVYILQTSKPEDLPALTSGIPTGATSCDRCTEQNLGPVLAGAVTDATGAFTIEGSVPVGTEIVLVVKAGRFRRAVRYTIPAEGACQTTTLPSAVAQNPTRLPRSLTDGLAVNIPRIAISTGEIDAIECVFEKMGLAHTEFGNPGAGGAAAARVHLYRGSSTGDRGAKIDNATPGDSTLYGDLARLQSYDLLVADCEGQSWDSGMTERDANGAKVREYVNRGGRMFASHLSFSWMHQNGTQTYAAATAVDTGLGPAAAWSTTIYLDDTGNGRISVGADRPLRSPRIQNFHDWMVNERVVPATGNPDFTIVEPRSMTLALGSSTEEFVYRTDGNLRVQQFSFNTPLGAPEKEACGRVAYSGFHVVPGSGSGNSPYANVTFPAHCTGDLSNQEKVLLYMLFDVGACVGATPLPPSCTPVTCKPGTCGRTPDGCGQLLDCGSCSPPTN